MRVRQALPGDRAAVEAFLVAHNAARVARRGELVDASQWPALIAAEAGALAGVLTYAVRDRECEVLTLHASRPWQGAGRALLAAVEQLARELECRRLWLVTTNDNVDALRLYQRRGFRLAQLHRGAVDASRARLKPGIPEVGDFGIPIHDEIELERSVG
jgi:GNAT superfamily N-acetyltransferase